MEWRTPLKTRRSIGHQLKGCIRRYRPVLVLLFVPCMVLLLASAIYTNRPPSNRQDVQAAPIDDGLALARRFGERARAEAMWIIFAAPPEKSDSLTSVDVLEAATYALCVEWLNESPTRPTFIAGQFHGTQVSSQPLCTAERRTEALIELRDLADRGRNDAAIALAYARYLGSDDDAQESFRWAKISMEADSTSAFYLMGLHYLNGQAVPKNDSEALRWLLRAANRDDIRAQLELCHLEGEVNIVESYAWCSLAASNPVQGEGASWLRTMAATSRDSQAKEMSASQVARGQRLAAERYEALEQVRSKQGETSLLELKGVQSEHIHSK